MLLVRLMTILSTDYYIKFCCKRSIHFKAKCVFKIPCCSKIAKFRLIENRDICLIYAKKYNKIVYLTKDYLHFEVLSKNQRVVLVNFL